ncbi:glycosyltransferase family 8 protein [Butyrivibrio fibrisolvens]|uniref:glycosyltransferase family 8 protein n=1 Tax=Butyrivibrio fibrisolvens TaxID=831 RepID=UPI00042991C7|nr:glycosyltransferase [Butyrivibrio fibrisolvens]
MTANVVYSFNEAYVHIASTSIVSLLDNNKDLQVVIHVLGENITEDSIDNMKKMISSYDAQILFYDTSNISEQIDATKAEKFQRDVGFSASNIIWYRFFAPIVVSEEIDRILYIGSDTLCTGSLKPMLEYDLSGFPIGMVVDLTNSRYKKVIGLDCDDIYYNDDVAIIDIKAWKESECTEKALNYLTKHGTKSLPLFSQDLYNVVLKDNIKKMPPQFAWLTPYWLFNLKGIYRVFELDKNLFYDEDTFNNGKENIIIHHFCGNSLVRPWYSNSKNPMKSEYDKYYIETNFKGEESKYWDVPFHYKIQIFTYKYMPMFINVFVNKLMYRYYMKNHYGV